MLFEKCGATVFLGDGNPSAGFTGDLPLGRLQRTPRAGSLSRRTVVLLELAQGPAKRGPLPASTAAATRRNAGVVERKLSLLTTFRAAPSHAPDSTGREACHPPRGSSRQLRQFAESVLTLPA